MQMVCVCFVRLTLHCDASYLHPVADESEEVIEMWVQVCPALSTLDEYYFDFHPSE